MKFKIIAFLGALMLALGLTVGGAFAPTATPDDNPVVKALAPEPASAAWGTDVTHSRNDSGYVAPIHVVCTNGNHRWLDRGESTFLGSSSSSCGYGGVNYIVTGSNQAVRCFNQLPPYGSHYFVGGWRMVPSYASLDCYMQRPL